MFIRHVMTTNVVTIPSSTSLADARTIMDAHRIRRLPVVDRERLVGIVTKDGLDRVGPSQLTTFSIHELSYLLAKLTVKEAMVRDVVTISPEATWEEGVALSQSRKVGSLVVVEDGRVVGIVTTNDFFFNIVNPILGIGVPGTRFHVHDCGEAAKVAEVLKAISEQGLQVLTMFTMMDPDMGSLTLTMQLDTSDTSRVLETLGRRGFDVHERRR